MRKQKSNPTEFNLHELAGPLYREAKELDRSLHWHLTNILRQHVETTNPGYVKNTSEPCDPKPLISLRLNELKAPLQMEASEMDKPLQWLVMKILKKHLKLDNHKTCSKP